MTFYDPPAGWRYGFPREYKPLPNETLEDTLRRDGYPQIEIDNGGAQYCRFWEQEKMSDKPRYSGPGRTGICKCGCPWDEHHLGVVMNREYAKATGEAYVPQECEAFGFNETGGMKFVDGKWVDHCHGYEDSGETK